MVSCIQIGDKPVLDNLRSSQIEPRKPETGEIQVRVRANSLNFHDYLVAIGKFPTHPGRVPLSDAAGEVLAVGENVSDFEPGDKVISRFFPNWKSGICTAQMIGTIPGDQIDGFATEVVTMNAEAFSRMPQTMSFSEAATLPCAGLTAWRGVVEEASLAPGDWVLVQGTGGVSIFALQIAKHLGCKVVATSSSDAKLQKLKAFGADEVINYRENPNWAPIICELTGGGANLVVEVGGPETIDQSVNSLAMGGSISMIGILTGFAGEFPLAQFFSRNATMKGICVGSHEHQNNMINAFDEWQLKPCIDKSFPLEQLADAFRYQESQQHFGKIVIEYP